MSLSRYHGTVAAVLASLCVARAAGAEPSIGTFDARGVKIRYVTQGTGEPVVLIHGLNASAALNWQLPGVFAALAKDYQVVAIDLPGHGGSDRPDKADAYGTQLAEDVVLLMDHLKLPKAHLVGYSLGGMITVKLLTVHPNRVLSATVAGMGWVRDNGRNLGLPARMAVPEGSGSLPLLVSTMGKLAVTEEAIKAVSVPVTVVIGERDRFKRMTVNPLRQVRPDWPVVEVKDANHISCVFKPDFIGAVTTWLSKNRVK
jgi:pimeloyl-ACP methyl ester carboxylesterase